MAKRFLTNKDFEDAPVYNTEAAADEAGLPDFSLYKTSTGEIRYKLPLVKDANAKAYLAAAAINFGQIFGGNGTTDYPLEAKKIMKGTDQYYIDLKAAGIYPKLKGLWMMLGATNANNFINGITPGIHNLTPVGAFGASFGRRGYVPGGNSNLNTGISLSDFGAFNMSAGAYMVSTGGGYAFGAASIPYPSYAWGYAPGAFVSFRDRTDFAAVPPSFETGLHIMSETAVNRKAFFQKGIRTNLITTGDGYGAPISDFGPIWFGQINFTNAYQAGGACTNQMGMFFLADGLTDDECVALTTITEKWAFAIRRNVSGEVFNAYQFLGDSITAKQLADPIYHGWSTAVCYKNDATELNYGVPGTTIVDCLNDAINNLVPKDSRHTKVFLAYSTNDFLIDRQTSGATMNLTLFSDTYADVLDAILAKGYVAADITIISGYYVGTTTYTGYPGVEGLQDSYLAAVSTIASGKGITRVLNLKPAMLAAGGDTLLNGIHPNNAGHEFIANYINTH